jgi:multidrug efflux pump
VFIPIAFLQGNVGRLFVEFAVAMAASVIFSSVAALSLAPMMCSKILRPQQAAPSTPGVMDRVIARSEAVYDRMLRAALARPGKVWALLALVVVGMLVVYRLVPQEFAPNEDRGAFFVLAKAQEGTSLAAMERNMIEVEKRVLPLVESGEATRVLTRVPGSFGGGDAVNSGLSIVVLEDWGKRRSIWEIMGESAAKAAQVPDVMAFPVTRRAFGGRTEAPVQFVLGGSEYDELGRWRDIILPKIAENKNLLDVDYDYKETKPQLLVKVDTVRAGDLGVAAESIGRTLEAMLGERRATTYIHKGEEYDVILEGERRKAQSPADLENLYVRSDTTGQLIPLSNLVTVEEVATSASLNRYNRTRAITFSANLAEGYRLGDALEFMETTVRENLPAEAGIDYKGESREYMDAGSAVIFTFALALVVVFLVLAAQFESFIHPLVIMLTVPLAVGGALVGLWLTGQTINIYSQIGIVMLVGLATKNGILIVEFANQLRSAGTPFDEALRAAAARRFRPIIMTSLTTIMGAVPLVFSGGAGAESRLVLGVVIMFGVALATLLTLVIIPVAYQALCRNTGSPDDVSHELEAQRKQVPNQIHDMI